MTEKDLQRHDYAKLRDSNGTTYFFASSSSGDSGEDAMEDENGESEGSTSTGRRTLPEPEPHDCGTPISLLPEVLGREFRPTSLVPASRPLECDSIDFSEVVSLFSWLDHATVIPEWTLPEGINWDESTLPWLDNEWWGMQPPEELWFYTDGSKKQDGTGAAVVLFVRSTEGWHYGGYLGQTCLRHCSHFAELQAVAMGFQWTYSILSFCSALGLGLPKVTYAFDATSAGYKAFGFWGGRSYDDEVGNLRSLWSFITQRFVFEWHTLHVAAHQGDPGNEAANTLAQIAADGRVTRRASSVRADYAMLTKDIAIHWLWALWKSEWTSYWQGTALCLPTLPTTTPDRTLIDRAMNRTTITTTTGTIRELNCTLATANVLTLLPGKKDLHECGLQGLARTESLQQMFEEPGVHVVGIQETRMRRLPKGEAERYFVIGGAANAQGHYGVQLWFSKNFALDGQERGLYFQCTRILGVWLWVSMLPSSRPSSFVHMDRMDKLQMKRNITGGMTYIDAFHPVSRIGLSSC